MTFLAAPQHPPSQTPQAPAATARLVRLLLHGCATTAIVFGAPVNLRTLATFGPPR